jgi:GNAT superfamily N-acetyltransferase
MMAAEGPAPRAEARGGAGLAESRAVPPVLVRIVRGRGDLKAFLHLPWRIYAHDPVWVPPLLHDVRSVMSRKHPFHAHADVEYFLAWKGARVVGRIAAIVNRRHVEFHDEPVGFFGLFEAEDDADVARALLAAAETWVARRGMKAIRGPMNLSTNDELYSPGVLVDGFDTPPVVLMAHTPAYYPALLEAAGYTKAKDLIAYWLNEGEPPERIVRSLERIGARAGVTLRPLDMSRFDREVAAIQEIYNSAWERNWGFVPMTAEEIAHLAKQLRPVVKPSMCALAQHGDTPVGFVLALPDYNQALRHLDGRLFPFGVVRLLWYRRSIDAARVITLGLTPGYRNKGLDAMLIQYIWRECVRAGHPKGECSWILEDNLEMRRGIERSGGRAYKTYRVFEKPLPD